MQQDEGDTLRTGLVVRSADGHRLGTVAEVTEGTLVVARAGSRLGRRPLVLSRAEVLAVRDDEVLLRHTRAEAAHLPASAEGARLEEEHEEMRVPLLQEEAVPEVHVRERGRVRVRKVVRTELRHLTVEVRREELVMEHLPADEDTPPRGASGPFEEDAHVFTLWKEEVEVVKRPVVYEEVRVTKGTQAERWCQRVPLRFEVAHVEEEDETSSAAPGGP